MRNLTRRANQFLGNEDGPTATEYAVLLALIITVAIASIRLFGVNLSSTFQDIVAALF